MINADKSRFDPDSKAFILSSTVNSAEMRSKFSNDPWAAQDIEFRLPAEVVCRMADWIRKKCPNQYPIF